MALAGVQKSLLSYFNPTIAPLSPVLFVLELFQDLLASVGDLTQDGALQDVENLKLWPEETRSGS